MAAPQKSVIYSAPISATVDAGNAGDVLIPGTAVEDRGRFVKATSANRGTRRSTGLAMAAYVARGSTEIQQMGYVPATITGLAEGAVSWVRVSAAGRLERVANVSEGDDAVGRCDAEGNAHLYFGLPLAEMIAIADAAVADDIARSAGTNIDRVRGIRGVTIAGSDGAPANVGATLVYNEVGGASYKRKRPVPAGWYDVTDYGAVADGVTDNTAAFLAAIAASSQNNPYSGGTSGVPYGSVIYVPPGPREYFFSGDLPISRQVHLMGVGPSGPWNPTVLRFAPGKGIIFYCLGNTPEPSGQAEWAEISNLKILCQPLTLPVRANLTAYSVGDRVRLPNDNRFYYECVTAGTTAVSSPFGGDTLTAGEFSNNNGRQLLVQLADGTVVWECKAACGILAFKQVRIHNLHIEDASNAGIMFYGKHTGVVGSNCNLAVVTDIRFLKCGVGVFIFGGDSNQIHVSNISCENIGVHYNSTVDATAGAGGFGVVDASFLGCVFINAHVEVATGRAIWSVDGVIGASAYIACYTEASGSSWVRGVVIGGDWGSGFAAGSPESGWSYNHQGWRNLWTKFLTKDKKPQIRWDYDTETAFHARLTDDDPGYNYLAERYYTAGMPGDGVGVGTWVVGAKGPSGIGERRIYGLTGGGMRLPSTACSGGSPEGPGNLRIFRGEFRDDSSDPYYVGYDSTSKTDRYVRQTQGVGGHRKPGDRFELKTDGATGSMIGEVVVTEGWEAPQAWPANSQRTVYYSQLGGKPSDMCRPTTPNGYAYVCSKNGTTHASVEPTWPTSYIGSGGIVPYAWTASRKFKVGDYCAPTTRNGHYYRVTAVSGGDVDGYANSGTVEPTWPTGSGATVVDGALTWTEQGSDVGTYVADGTTEWQCVGPVPTYSSYGEIGVHKQHGVGTQAMSDADQTPTSSVYLNGVIKTTGAITADRTLSLPPATDADAYRKIINNACTGAFSVVVSSELAGTTVSVANGMTATVLIDSRGVTRVTADA